MENPDPPPSDTTPYLHKAQQNEAVRHDDVIKHLEFIQATIIRMAANSFFLKGWTITLVAALFALSAKDSQTFFALIAFVPAIGFWILDGYFLHQERCFRKLYDHVRIATESELLALQPFDMDVKKARDFASAKTWREATFSTTLFCFYGFIMVAIVCVFTISGFLPASS